eukprot:TRINITY_DN110897_c0_g1_i1.p1 TRINITY_DN110897_c0_g1~~TRINITY_DN110897_c0_g1_i1.p1  ORF type:complete len:348 (-),score=76.43 TRINITY_DN110897_c0_g1_i1:4-1047(-)
MLSPGISALPGAMPFPSNLAGPKAAPKPPAAAPMDPDAKTKLNQFCQRYCQRPVTKNDVLYSITRFNKNECQAVVKLNCMEGQEFAGELCENAKDAEKSAALQAMAAYAAIMQSLPLVKPAAKKKQSAVDGGAAGKTDAQGENPAVTNKVKLNALCMKIIKRPLQKGETVYDTAEVGLGKSSPSAFQTTVRFPCLPGEWATKAFVGKVSEQKQAAEQDAAGIALAAMVADPVLTEVANAKPPKKETSGEGKGKGWNKWKKWWGGGGPDLPREVVTATPVAATVEEWKGSYGWVKLTEALDHPAASKRQGSVYLHKQDLKNGKESLEKGMTLLVSIYADPSGLGAVES